MNQKILLVTGASRGIGAGIAKLAGSDGWQVCVNYASSKSEADAVVEDIVSAGGQATSFQADVRLISIPIRPRLNGLCWLWPSLLVEAQSSIRIGSLID